MELIKFTMLNLAVFFLFLQIVPITIEAKSKYTDEDKPYEFGFNIEGQQHRREKKDENGIIMGEFGFITADGVYHVTVYATDAEGNFKILSMKNIRLGAAPDVTPRPLLVLTSTLPPVPNYQSDDRYKTPSTAKPIVLTTPVAAPVASCSHCSIPTPPPPPPPALPVPNYNQQQPSIDLQTPFDKPQNPSYGNDQYQPQSPDYQQNPEYQQNPDYQQSPDYQQDPGNPQYQNQDHLNNHQTGPSTQGPAYSDASNNPGFNPILVSAVMRPVNLEDIPTTTGPGESPGLPNGITEPDMLDLLYRFNYTVGFHGHREEGYTNGAKKGEYYVNNRNGYATKVSYTADATGFHPKIQTVRLADADTPKEETEKNDEYGLKGYEFEWFYVPKYHYLNQ